MGEENIADALTKYLPWEKISRQSEWVGVKIGGERNPNMPEVSKGEKF